MFAEVYNSGQALYPLQKALGTKLISALRPTKLLTSSCLINLTKETVYMICRPPAKTLAVSFGNGMALTAEGWHLLFQKNYDKKPPPELFKSPKGDKLHIFGVRLAMKAPKIVFKRVPLG
jgi:hypothetical protein